MFNRNFIKKPVHLNSNDPKPVQKICSHKKKLFNKSIHIKKSVHPNSNDPNYANFFISFTMQKYFEIASIRV